MDRVIGSNSDKDIGTKVLIAGESGLIARPGFPDIEELLFGRRGQRIVPMLQEVWDWHAKDLMLQVPLWEK